MLLQLNHVEVVYSDVILVLKGINLAVDAGQMAVILGNSAVVNSSSSQLPASGNLDAMRLNWGPYLWMRCYNNGAQFLDRIVGPGVELTKAKQALRSSIFRKQGRLADAAGALDALLAVAPDHVETLMLRASIMETMGNLPEQEQSLKRAFQADPLKAAVPLSSFYLRAGRFDEAAAIADSALQT